MARIILVCLASVALLSACGGGSDDGRLQVVASTNVYGDIVRQIGDGHVAVTSILTDPDADPHLYEPGTAAGLAVARAGVVVQNGLGYDTFMDRLEEASPSDSRRVVNVADLIGIHGSDANPHLWYDVPALDTVAAGIERALAQSDPTHRRDYAAGRRRFVQRLRPVERVLRRIDRRAASTPIAFTEPVPEYLTQAAGLRNLAPQSFTHPIAQGSEPPAAAVAEMTDLVAKRRVRVLLYNKQAVSPVTARVRAAAQRAGVPVIAVTETLPRGASFQGWMLAQSRALAGALGV